VEYQELVEKEKMVERAVPVNGLTKNSPGCGGWLSEMDMEANELALCITPTKHVNVNTSFDDCQFTPDGNKRGRATIGFA